MLDFPSDLKAKIDENPGVVFEDAAREHNLSPRAVGRGAC